MVKRREIKNTPNSLERRIEDFASAADQIEPEKISLNSDAPRNYKAIRVPFNQFEFEVLEKLCKKTGRSKLNMIRYALKYYDENCK